MTEPGEIDRTGQMADLVLRGGRVIDPVSGRDETTDIAFGEGKVVAVGHDLPGGDVVDARGLLVVPGLIDLHTHVYWGGTSLGVDAAEVARRSGTTTLSMPAAPVLAISPAFAVISSSRRRCASSRT